MADEEKSRLAFYEAISQRSLAPLWEVMAKLVPPQPASRCDPFHWDFQQMRGDLAQAGQLISAEEAERRVLVLENPRLRGESRITSSLYAGYQLILPGETAHSHRHTATAIRLILEGEGACTSVGGERTPMHPGDFIITPSWTFHDHGNPGTSPVVWLDGLDVPIVQLFEAGFSERLGEAAQTIHREEDESLAAFGHGMAPAHLSPPVRNPMFRYPYSRVRPALQKLAQAGRIDPWDGVLQEYINPVNGGPATRTMAAFMQWLPANFLGRPIRNTAGTVYCVVEGEGRSDIGSVSYDWKRGDTFVVPSWTCVAHHTGPGAVLFSFSDRPAQRALGLWREERLREAPK
jgi:gentisate 1,2-dioxygenase